MAPLAGRALHAGVDKNNQTGIADLFGHFRRELLALNHFDPRSVPPPSQFLSDAAADPVIRAQRISISDDQGARPAFGGRGIASRIMIRMVFHCRLT